MGEPGIGNPFAKGNSENTPDHLAFCLVNDGRRVLGIHIQQGAIIDRFSLVAEGEAK